LYHKKMDLSLDNPTKICTIGLKFTGSEGMITEYAYTALPDVVRIDGIVTVLRHTYDETSKGSGESHDFPELLFIERGEHFPIVDGKEYALREGQMILYPPNAYHTARKLFGAEAAILSFRTDSVAIDPLFNQVITLTSAQKQTLLQIVSDGLSCFTNCGPAEKKQGKKGMILKENADPKTLQRIKKQLEFFLADLCSLPAGANKRDREFDGIKNYLARNIDRSLSLGEIAEGCGMSVSKLKLLCREKSGGGAIDYFLRIKIDRAKDLIREGDLNFSQIADRLGFSSLHYFSRTFKRITGVSPSQFEKSE